MADLYIDFAGLERTRDDLERISGLLHAPLAAIDTTGEIHPDVSLQGAADA